MEPLISARGLWKIYPGGVEANKGIDLDLHPGRVYALLGENGAGKTTLVKMLTGVERPSRGRILVEGREARLQSPRDAYRLGLYMVPQHPTLFDSLRVYEDVGLALRQAGVRVDRHRARKLVVEAASSYGLRVDPDAPIAGMSVGEKQRVEIVKGILLGRRALFLDEPSTHMTPREVESLVQLSRRLAREGRVVVYITHRIEEALEAADEVIVMRGGLVSARLDASTATRDKVLRAMFPEIPSPAPERRRAAGTGEAVLRVEDLWVKSTHGGWALRGVNLELRRGEVLGVAGVAGNGQRELLEAIVGLVKPSRGRVYIGGVRVDHLPPRERLRMGMAVVPEERLGWSVVPIWSVWLNASLPLLARNGGGVLLNRRRAAAIARAIVREAQVRAPSLDAPAAALSGGNIQRLVLGRELASRPRLLVAMNPAAGLDYRAAVRVEEMISSSAEGGTGVLLIDEDLELLARLSDRIVVMSRGRVVGEFRPPYSAGEIAEAMTMGG